LVACVALRLAGCVALRWLAARVALWRLVARVAERRPNWPGYRRLVPGRSLPKFVRLVVGSQVRVVPLQRSSG